MTAARRTGAQRNLARPEHIPGNAPPMANAVWISRDLIDADAQNLHPLVSNDPTLTGLRDSIAAQGILQPLLIRPSKSVPGRFKLDAGRRRFYASQTIEGYQDVVPCIILSRETAEGGLVSLVENLQRSESNPTQEARLIASIMEAAEEAGEPYSILELAEELGVSPKWVKNRIDLIATREDVQELVERKPLAVTAALRINTIPDEAKRKELIQESLQGAPAKVIDEKVSEFHRQHDLDIESRKAMDAPCIEVQSNPLPSVQMGSNQPARHTAPAVPLENTLDRLRRSADQLKADWAGHPPNGKRRAQLLASLEAIVATLQEVPR
jgi:ParB/RepB/Spo0J family partition protein